MASVMLHVLKEEESALRLYFNDISDSTPLSREQEVVLSTRIREGDMVARDELVRRTCASSSTSPRTIRIAASDFPTSSVPATSGL